VAKRRDDSWRGLKPWQRLTLGSIGLAIFSTGAFAQARGLIYYNNYAGGWGVVQVFAPFSLLIGALVVLMAFRLGPRRR
jgi:hypothetical protein